MNHDERTSGAEARGSASAASTLSERAVPEIPEHVPRELVKPYPFIRGRWTYDDPFKTLVPGIHEEMPDIFYSSEAIPGRRPAWILRRAEDLRAVYVDTEHFSNKAFSRGEMIGENWSNVPSETDPPMHGIYRAVLNPLFSPRRMRELEDPVRRYARQYIAKFKHRGSCEFLTDFAFRFPIAVFLDLMGLPQDQLETFLEWEHSLLHEPDLAKMLAATRVVVTYLRRRIDACRSAPGADFISVAVTTELDGRQLTDDEVVGLCFNLFIGGLDTVSTNLGLHFRHLAESPADQRHLRENPSFIPVALEELLRAFAAVTTLRVCTKETTLKGVTFRPGDKIAMSTTLGSNDPAAYERPSDVILGRKGTALTFGHGVHHCIGAHLARREIIVAMEEFLAAIPEFRIEAGTKIRTRLGTIIQPESLPLVWSA